MKIIKLKLQGHRPQPPEATQNVSRSEIDRVRVAVERERGGAREMLKGTETKRRGLLGEGGRWVQSCWLQRMTTRAARVTIARKRNDERGIFGRTNKIFEMKNLTLHTQT